MANTSANVSTGKPNIGGAIYYAPAGTTLPTDATTTLDTAFKCLGYVSEDGVTNGMSVESNPIKAWGGDTVANPLTGKTDTFQFSLIESLNKDVLEVVFGSANVTGSLADGMTVKSKSEELTRGCWVVETILTGNTLNRLVIADGQVTSIGDIAYKDNEPIAYNLTVTAYPVDGTTHTEYKKQ